MGLEIYATEERKVKVYGLRYPLSPKAARGAAIDLLQAADRAEEGTPAQIAQVELQDDLVRLEIARDQLREELPMGRYRGFAQSLLVDALYHEHRAEVSS